MPAVTLKQKAYDRLKQLLLNGEINSNEQLTEKYLTEKLGMSRTPIRAALERLTVERLLNYSSNKGISLVELSLMEVLDFYDFRKSIEGYIVKKISLIEWEESDLLWFRDNLAKQEEYMRSRDYAAFTLLDSAFHRKLAEVYGNQEMIQAMDQLQDKLYQVALKVLRKDKTRIQISYEDHVALFDAIVDGKTAEAEQLIYDHLEIGARILMN
ncbi:GntR family transcriptional regulator [Paenibacillus oryzisoli]|uniref:GntR family transcriptional regulator n=1 Tax=Paenibacillus oryzisoli TaxID=1850517 RepID=UPI003D27BEBB